MGQAELPVGTDMGRQRAVEQGLGRRHRIARRIYRDHAFDGRLPRRRGRAQRVQPLLGLARRGGLVDEMHLVVSPTALGRGVSVAARVTDPRTGEILDADIGMSDVFARGSRRCAVACGDP